MYLPDLARVLLAILKLCSVFHEIKHWHKSQPNVIIFCSLSSREKREQKVERKIVEQLLASMIFAALDLQNIYWSA